MSLPERLHQLRLVCAAVELPHSGGVLFFAARCQKAAVGTEDDHLDIAGIPLQGGARFLSGPIPEPDGLVPACGCHQSPIGTEGDTLNASRMPTECGFLDPGGELPYPDIRWPAARGDESPVGTERRA